MIPEWIVYPALVLPALAVFSYIRDTVAGSTKPNRVTWFLWALAPMIAFIAEIYEHASIGSLLLTFVVGFGPLLIFLSSFVNRNAYWRITKFDLACGAMSVLALILWWRTGEGLVAIFLAILADLFAGIPTLIKTYRHPATETSITFLYSASFAVISLLTLTNWNFANTAFVLYILVIDSTLFTLGRFPNFRFSPPATP